jgi:Tfp pilus assembly protein PilF
MLEYYTKKYFVNTLTTKQSYMRDKVIINKISKLHNCAATFAFCGAFTLLITAPVHADSARFPGSKQGSGLGTTLNSAPQAAIETQAPTQAAAAEDNQDSSVKSSSGHFFSGVFSGIANAVQPSAPAAAPAQQVAQESASAGHTITEHDLGDPDSSPALFAARQELDIEPPAKTAEMPANNQQAIATPLTHPVDAPQAQQAAPQWVAPEATASAAAPVAPVATATAEPAHIDPVHGEPDNSPALYAKRRELDPVQNPNRLTSVLTQLMKPLAEGEGDKSVAGEPVAAYESPGVVIKRESFRQETLQPNLTETEIKLASLNPSSGTGGPLIQLPDVPPPVLPAQNAAPADKKAETKPAIPAADVKALVQTPPAKPAAAPVITTTPAPTPVIPAAPAPAIAAPATKPAAKTADVKPAVVEKSATQANKSENSEPKATLSNESKNILNKIPANIDTPAKKSVEPIAVDRSAPKDTAKDNASSPASVKHEAMGIKIEVKSPKLDLSYELEKAYNAMTAGQSETAIGIYKNILDNDPDNKNALFGLGTLYHRAGQIDSARKLYAKLLSIDPTNRDGLNNFLVLLADEAPEAALTQLEKLEKRDPKFSPIPAQMAIIHEKLGNPDKATEKMFRAVDLSPENMVYRYNLAIMLDKQKKYDEAGKLYRQIIEAYHRGETIPGNVQQIQQRLTYISSNRP